MKLFPAFKRQHNNAPATILFASVIGTTIEFFDFYIYATAAVLVFPKVFFPAADPTAATLASLATFAIAFLARPVGSVVFGHFGDRAGRKVTLVAALLTMGLSTAAVGALPTYRSIGITAPLLLALCRFGQGLGLGGEWGGAVLLAVENAPLSRRALYGMFPQLGAPVGFFLSGGVFLLLSNLLSDQQFASFGWRIPFLASGALVVLGLYLRIALTETPVFQAVLTQGAQVRLPIIVVLRHHMRAFASGTIISLATFVLFYLVTVFALSWGTSTLHFPKSKVLAVQLIGALLFATVMPLSAILAERGRKRLMIYVSLAIGILGLLSKAMITSGPTGGVTTMIVGFILMGFTYAPLGTMISELFPTPLRYTGTSLAFSVAGILGASLAPYVATWLASSYGLKYVGYYLTSSAIFSMLALFTIREAKDLDLDYAESD